MLSQKVTHLLGGFNRFYGTLPTQAGLLTNLLQMNFSGNTRVDGTIPSEFGLLTKLELFDSRYTAITGPVPPALCDRVAQGLLDFHANCSLVECCSKT